MNATTALFVATLMLTFQAVCPSSAHANRSAMEGTGVPHLGNGACYHLFRTALAEPTLEKAQQLKSTHDEAAKALASAKESFNSTSGWKVFERRRLEAAIIENTKTVNESGLALDDVLLVLASKMSAPQFKDSVFSLVARLPKLGNYGSSPNRLAGMTLPSEFGVRSSGFGENSVNANLIAEVNTSPQLFHIVNAPRGGFVITVRLDEFHGYNWYSAYKISEKELYDFLAPLLGESPLPLR